MIVLTKLSESQKTLTLAWLPPAEVDMYAFYADGKRVSTGDDTFKDGSPRNQVEFAKGAEPYEVVALVRKGTVLYEVAAGQWPAPVGDGFLAWAPPLLFPVGSNLVEFEVTDATRRAEILTKGAGRDLRINQTQAIRGSMDINGWRNVVWIGGEMNASDTVTGIAIRNITGTFHLEGFWGHGRVADVFVIRSPETNTPCVIQIQNSRLEAVENGPEHSDCIQFQQAKVAGLRLDKVTLCTELQSCFMRVGGSTVDNAKNIDLRRVNFRGTGDNAFWQNWENGDNTSTLKQILPVNLEDVWVAEDGDTRSVGMRVVPRSDFYSGAGSASGQGGNTQWANSRRGCFVATDATGEYAYFSDGTQRAPNGQQSLDCGITGIIRKGIPLGGDFVPTNLPGVGYESPGYE